jgi:hypothetical protein
MLLDGVYLIDIYSYGIHVILFSLERYCVIFNNVCAKIITRLVGFFYGFNKIGLEK